jgi:hypothetical protein
MPDIFAARSFPRETMRFLIKIAGDEEEIENKEGTRFSLKRGMFGTGKTRRINPDRHK